MARILKVFVSGKDQENLARRFPTLQRYEGFILLEATPEQAEKLALKYLVEDITDQYSLKIAGQVIETIQASPTSDELGIEAVSFSTPTFAPPPEATTATSSLGEMHHFLVVFIGPIMSEWLEQVQAAGGELRAPYQNFTYVVNADEQAIEKITNLPCVRWTGRLPSWARIASAIRNRSTLDDTTSSLPRTRTLPSAYIVELFSNADLPAASLSFTDLGAKVLNADPQAGVLIIEISGTEDQRMALLEALAAVHGVRSIRERSIKRISNDLAVGLLGVELCQQPAGIDLSGDGEIIAIADTGLDSGDPSAIHPDFAGRIVWIKSYPITTDFDQHIANPGGNDGAADLDTGHGTHVAGSALGSGVSSQNIPAQDKPIRGLAYKAQLIFQALEQQMDWTSPAFFSKYGRFLLAGIPLDLSQLFEEAYQCGARIHSNSWGGGDPGAYDTQCEQLDRFVWEHKDFCVLVAAGNDGTDRDQDGLVDPLSISSPGTAKNCITVGASESRRPAFKNATYGLWWPNDYAVPPLRDDLMANDPQQVVAFSSRGPTLDGRIKPDLVAPGTFILSTRSTRLAPNNMAWGSFAGSRMYFYNGGTSMATPLVAGAAALVRESLIKHHAIANPTAALVKATLVASARRIKSHAPKSALCDNEQGYGRVDLASVLAPQAPAQVKFLEIKPGLETGQVYNFVLNIKSKSHPLRIVLAYSDYPGRSLVNNLNLIMRGPTGRVYAGNAPAGKLALDNKNNLEMLHIPRPRPGEWQVSVVAANVPNGPQEFALVAIADFDA